MIKHYYFILILLMFSLAGCYSFTGGSIPAHLHTLQITSVTDNSGFGIPQYKVDLETNLIDIFTRDNSLELVDNSGDARLTVSISSILEATNTIGTSELETERKITVTCSVEYYDNVEQKKIWDKTFSNYGTFDVAQALTARDETIQVVLKQISEDIMLAVVSGW